MIVFIECLILAVFFTLFTVSSVLKDPLSFIGDYPPAIGERCVEIGLISERKKRFSNKELIRKALAMIIMAALFALIMKYVNKAESFYEGFRDSYIIWLFITWYDAIVLDCLWFCHSEKVRIPGTEDMKEYQDYLFHIRQSLIGTLLGLPVCLFVGLFVSLF